MQKQMFEKAKSLSMLITGRAEPCAHYFCVVRLLARPCRAVSVSVALMVSAGLLVACAPTFAPHIDSPAMPASDSPQNATQCTQPGPLNTEKEKIAPLDPRPLLPDATQSQCPLGSGLAACFTLEQDVLRQKRFKILHDDRDYCRDAYERAVTRGGESAVTSGDGDAATRGDGGAFK